MTPDDIFALGREGPTPEPVLPGPKVLPPKLSEVEARILGCLLEKERTTPEVYPLSLNGMTNACNQSSNRDPVVFYEERVVEHGVELLREKNLASMVLGAGSRVQKYRHKLLDHYDLNSKDVALVCVLLLRGPQTIGELRTRSERLHSFSSIEEVLTSLTGLMEGGSPLVKMIPAGPGQKEKRYIQLLSEESQTMERFRQSTDAPTRESTVLVGETQLQSLTEEVKQLRDQLEGLKKEFCTI